MTSFVEVRNIKGEREVMLYTSRSLTSSQYVVDLYLSSKKTSSARYCCSQRALKTLDNIAPSASFTVGMRVVKLSSVGCDHLIKDNLSP